MDTKIASEIWDDDEFAELDTAAKLAFFWCLTQCDNYGFVEIKPRRFLFDTNLDLDALERAQKGLKGLERASEKILWVRNYIARQLGRNGQLTRNNIGKSLAKGLEGLQEKHRILVLSEYPELSPTEGLGTPSQGGREGEGEGERKEGSGEENPSPDPLDIYGLYAAASGKNSHQREALIAIRASIDRGEWLETIDERTRLIAEQLKRWPAKDRPFIPSPATFFENERWRDDPKAWAPKADGKTPGTLPHRGKVKQFRPDPSTAIDTEF